MRLIILPLLLLLLTACIHNPKQNEKASAESVRVLTQKVADWQIAYFYEEGKYRALPTKPPEWMNRDQYHDLEWHHGALYAGMNEWRKVPPAAEIHRLVNGYWQAQPLETAPSPLSC